MKSEESSNDCVIILVSLSESSTCEASAADSLAEQQSIAMQQGPLQVRRATLYRKSARMLGQRRTLTFSEEKGIDSSFSVLHLTATLNTLDSLYTYCRIFHSFVFHLLSRKKEAKHWLTQQSRLLFRYSKKYIYKAILRSIHLNVKVNYVCV